MSRDFWSRRREAVAQEERAEEAAVHAAEEAGREAALADTPDAALLAEAGMPAPEMLDTPEAVREFLATALPQRLKARALRRLWRLNPVLANVDGLVDYGEDFRDSATVIENMQTAYQVGKGMMSHIRELARQAETAAEPPETEPAPEPEEAEPIAVAATDDTPAAPAQAEASAGDPPHDAPPAPRRRMTFTFDEQRTL